MTETRPIRGRRRQVLVVATLGAAAAGCIPPQRGVPTWAMHVQPGAVDADALPTDVAARLAYELGFPRLARGHLAPEQLGVVAVRELEQGRLADAALWLSIATYRYHQESVRARGIGRAARRSCRATWR